jgi:SAM-dependent methyltransferase
MKQVDKKYYEFGNYSHPERWASYYYQLKETFALKPESILEIGVGDKVFGNFIMDNSGIVYSSMDIADDLTPDIIGSATAIPLEDSSRDLVCAFEILEHIKFEEAEKALAEIARVSKLHAVISVPHFGPPVRFLLKIPFMRELHFMFKLPFLKRHVFNGEHYWELGKKGFPPARFRAVLEKHFTILKDYVPFESPYHHFFVLKKR